jgi:murein DD-endopeptidase MepM/ murein hydrolase activator NlpD
MKPVTIVTLGLLAIFPATAEACETGSQFQHPAKGEIYRRFGNQTNPVLGVVRLHSGFDYSGAAGEPVSAAEAGTVVSAGPEEGYGNYVRIDHGNGLMTAYAHMSNFSVKQGQCVGKGEVIGTIGASGVASKPHLHFEVIENGRFTDPGPLLPKVS